MEDLGPKTASHVEHDDTLSKRAAAATAHEKQMGFGEAVKSYRKAIGWSMLLSTAVVMEGFDLVLIGSFFAFPSFNEKYGDQLADGSYQISAAWQSALTNGALAGEIIGLFLTGFVVERFGYRKTMILSLFCMIGAIFVPFFAPNIGALVAGEVLCGIPWGAFQGLAPAYAAEICPVNLRAYLTTYVNLCFVMGQLLSSGILRAFATRDDQWAYRVPFALQWMWPVPILLGCLFAPESPWWLIRHGREEEARCVLTRLQSNTGETAQGVIDNTIGMMIYTNKLEHRQTEGTTFVDCFRKTDLRRTEIASVAYAAQMVCGSSLMGYSVYFYQQAGLPTVQALNLSIGQFAIGFVGTICSWWLMTWFGRRTLYLTGITCSVVLCTAMGAVGIPKRTTHTSWATGSLLLALTFFYDISLGPICFCIVSEIPSTRLRSKTVMVARSAYNLAGIICNILTPRMINPTAWGWSAKSGFFWGGVSAVCLVWTYFRLPEAKGRTYAELDILFEKRVSARKFSSTQIRQLELH